MFFVFLIICTALVDNIFAGPTYGSASENKLDTDYKVTLLSIEDKLRNIENSLSVQYVTTLNGKIDYYGRKIDNIEKELSRFQRFVTMELDKISENISAGNFKDNVANDKTARKIDAIYERINHKLGNIEGQIDISSIKSQSGRDMTISKLDKIEETLTIRDSDMEAELADAIAAIDDLKTSCSNIEGNVINMTKETAKMLFKHGDKNLKKHFNQTFLFLEKTNQSFSNGITKLTDTINSLTSQVNDNSILMNITNKEFNENMNDYGNKMTDAFSDMTETTVALKNKIEHLAKIANTSRFEQQNSLRALTVEVGRNVEKPSETTMNDQNFKILSDDIESKFESIMGAQNLFIESCHRVQMDEAQMETQISVVLDKLIDIFVNKTTIGPKDIQKLENLIRLHDVTIRRSFNQITNELLKRIQQISTENEEDAKNLKMQLEEIYFTVHGIITSNDNSKRMQAVLHIFHDLQQQFNKTNKQVLNSLNENYANSSLENNKLQSMIASMHGLLGKMENKMNESNLDEIVDRFGEKLKDYLKTGQDVGATKNKTDFELSLLEIFGENPNHANDDDDAAKRNKTRVDPDIFREKANGTEENGSVLCFNSVNNTKCETHTFPKQNISNPEHVIKKCIFNLTDTGINSDGNCSESIDQTHSGKIVDLTKTADKLLNCSSNYGDLIDVRFDINCNSTDEQFNVEKNQSKTDTNVVFNNCSNYGDLIDVRSGIPDCIPQTDTLEVGPTENVDKNKNDTPVENNAKLTNCSNYGDLIDVRSGIVDCISQTDPLEVGSTNESENIDKNKNDTQVQNNVNLTNCSNYGDLIDVRSGSPDCIPKMDQLASVEQVDIGQSEVDPTVDEFNINFSLSPEDEFLELLRIDEVSTTKITSNEDQR